MDIKVGDKFFVNKGFKTFAKGDIMKDVLVSKGTVIEYTGIGSYSNSRSKYHEFVDTKNGNEFYFWSNALFKKVTPHTEGDPLPVLKSTGYKIKLNGKFFKPKKFSDLGKVKSSLLIAFGYYSKLQQNANKERNPELTYLDIPYWFEGYEEIKLDEFKNVEIVEVDGKKQTPVDFNAYEYIKESNVKLQAVCEFGSAVKELFSKLKDDNSFRYFLSYEPQDYLDFKKNPDGNSYYVDELTGLKECPVIKDAIKKTGIGSKDIKKVTKHGKTAIAFKNEENLFKLTNILPTENVSFFTITNEGVAEYDKEMRRKKIIRNLMADE